MEKKKNSLKIFVFLSTFFVSFVLLQSPKNLPQKTFETLQKNFPEKRIEKIEKKINASKEKANEIIISKEGKKEKIKVQPQLKKIIKQNLLVQKDTKTSSSGPYLKNKGLSVTLKKVLKSKKGRFGKNF